MTRRSCDFSLTLAVARPLVSMWERRSSILPLLRIEPTKQQIAWRGRGDSCYTMTGATRARSHWEIEPTSQGR